MSRALLRLWWFSTGLWPRNRGTGNTVRNQIAAKAPIGLGNIAVIHGIHLPVRSCRPPEFKNRVAIFAIFAARMAFSSLAVRLLGR